MLKRERDWEDKKEEKNLQKQKTQKKKMIALNFHKQEVYPFFFKMSRPKNSFQRNHTNQRNKDSTFITLLPLSECALKRAVISLWNHIAEAIKCGEKKKKGKKIK